MKTFTKYTNTMHEGIIEILAHLTRACSYKHLIEYVDNVYPGLSMFLTPETVGYVATKYGLGHIDKTPRGTTYWFPSRNISNQGAETSRTIAVRTAIHTALLKEHNTKNPKPLTAREITRRLTSNLNLRPTERDRILADLVDLEILTATETLDRRGKPQVRYTLTQPLATTNPTTPTTHQPTNHVPW
jgi:hypothetical protein